MYIIYRLIFPYGFDFRDITTPQSRGSGEPPLASGKKEKDDFAQGKSNYVHGSPPSPPPALGILRICTHDSHTNDVPHILCHTKDTTGLRT